MGSVKGTKTMAPPQTQSIAPPPPPPPPHGHTTPQSNYIYGININNNNNKRKLISDDDDGIVDINNSAYFKIRALLHQLRPHFIQVLRTPDFQNCKSAHEIRKGMKIVMDLYKQMQIEGTRKGKFDASAGQALPGEREPKKEKLDVELHQGKSPKEHLQDEQVSLQSVEKISPPPISSEEKFGDGEPQGTYIVGGSVSGWNFITYGNRRPLVYYGVTKESRLCSHNKSENGNLRIH